MNKIILSDVPFKRERKVMNKHLRELKKALIKYDNYSEFKVLKTNSGYQIVIFSNVYDYSDFSVDDWLNIKIINAEMTQINEVKPKVYYNFD